ncbi:auxilin-like protein 1 [Rhodamnia argentea]|uniref:Auxilin-like protein 1 n=1 Tax=Rhodamnia argentea TaxID=178133 RepID=A0ABM3HI69_9MYRT|nr:auxilin-like protein 1 [Rhodamnia argentea]
MENLPHSLHPSKLPKKPAHAPKTIYDDVFGGPPRYGGVPALSPRAEDYGEIFGGFHAPRASAIPVLDLPAAGEADAFFDVRSPGFDYSEVFGGYGGLDFADGLEVLVRQSNGGDCGSSDEAWTPSASDYLSEESDHSGSNQFFSNGDPYNSVDADIEYNMSYHKANIRSNSETSNGIRHANQIRAVPGFSYLVDQRSTIPYQEYSDPSLWQTCDDNPDVSFCRERMKGKGKHLRKTVSNPSNTDNYRETYENDMRPQREYGRMDSCPNKPFVTISEISLRTEPSHLPPPSRPPPAFDFKIGDASRSASSWKEMSPEGSEGDGSPRFFDVEVDASSSAAVASAAAMKEAMDKAQARLRSARDLMQRKKEGVRRTKLGSYKDSKDKMGKVRSKVADEMHSPKVERVQAPNQRDSGEMQSYITRNVMEPNQVTSDENISKRRGKESSSSQMFGNSVEAAGWKEATLLSEMTGIDRSGGAHEHTNRERVFEYANNHGNGQIGKKADVKAFETQESSRKMKVDREAYRGMEFDDSGRRMGNKEKPTAAKQVLRQKDHERKDKVIEGFVQSEGIEKKHKMASHQIETCSWPENAQYMKKHESMGKVLGEVNDIDARKGVQRGQDGKNLEKVSPSFGSEELKESYKIREQISDWEERRPGIAIGQEKIQHGRRMTLENENTEKNPEGDFKWTENGQKKEETAEEEEKKRRLQEVSEQEEEEKKLNKLQEPKDKEKLKEAQDKEDSERRLREADEQEEKNRRLREAREREENERRQKEILEKEEERRLREAHEREENERRRKEILEKEEKERRLREAHEREENEKERRQKEILEKERRLREAHERDEKEKERRQKEILEKEEERRLREAHEREEKEKERRQKEILEKEEKDRRLREAREHEEIERKFREAIEKEEKGKMLREALEVEEREKKVKEAQEIHEDEKKPAEVRQQEDSGKMLKPACGRGAAEKVVDKSQANEENEKCVEEAAGFAENHEALMGVEKNEEIKVAFDKGSEPEEMDNAFKDNIEFEVINDRLHEVSDIGEFSSLTQDYKLAQKDQVCQQNSTEKIRADSAPGECDENLETSTNTEASTQASKVSMNESGSEKKPLAVEITKMTDEGGKFSGVAQAGLKNREDVSKMDNIRESQPLDNRDKKTSATFAGVEQMDVEASGRVSHDSRNTSHNERKSVHEKGERKDNIKQNRVPSHQNEKKEKFTSTQVMKEGFDMGKKTETSQPDLLNPQKTGKQQNAPYIGVGIEKIVNRATMAESTDADGLRKEQELEMERLRRLEEEREREREREKDRMAVDRATLEARERVLSEARERAERAALERATTEARQRAMMEARGRLEKVCAEARERTFTEKSSSEARFRAAMERATAEARERAAERAMAEKATSDKFSTSRYNGMRESSQSLDLRDTQNQSAGCSINSRYASSSGYSGSHDSERSEVVEGESAQRCRARLERHRRTAERAAKALAEKNMRDLLAQREQAERNRLAETLDADVKRWSSNKEGNLRALLSTLQYILGPDSGWQPIPLTEVITSAAVKRAYRKATLCVHPDKLQQRGASIQQKYICEKVFDLLKEAWNKFNSEER